VETLRTFLEMGGYAAFIWPAYALAFTGLTALLIQSRRSVLRRQAELDRLRPPRSETTSEQPQSPESESPRQNDGAEAREA
jgi:heme exporter protein D